MAGIESSGLGVPIPGSNVSGISALAGTPYAAWDWALMNMIISTMIDGRNQKVPLLDLLYKSKRTVGGKFVNRFVRDGRNYAGISAIHPDGNMPDPLNQGLYMYSTAIREIYLRMRWSNQLLARFNSAEVSAIDGSLIEYEIGGITQDLAIKQEIMLHGDGSGRRAEISSVTDTSASVTVRHNQDHESIGTVSTDAAIYLDVGMRIAFVSSAGAVRVYNSANQAFYVVAKPSTGVINISLTPGGAALTDFGTGGGHWGTAPTAGDWIVDASRDASMGSTSGVPLDTAWRQEPMGLEGMFRRYGVLDGIGISVAGQQTGAFDYTDTSKTAAAVGFQGVPCNSSPSGFAYATPAWNKAIVLDGSAALRPVGDDVLQGGWSDSHRINNAMPSLIVSGWDLYNSYVSTLITDKRFVTNSLAGGHANDGNPDGGVTFNNLRWLKSRFMLGNRLMMLDPNMIEIWENTPLSIAAPPGATPYERLGDKDAFWKAMKTGYQVFTPLRQRLGCLITDLS